MLKYMMISFSFLFKSYIGTPYLMVITSVRTDKRHKRTRIAKADRDAGCSCFISAGVIPESGVSAGLYTENNKNIKTNF